MKHTYRFERHLGGRAQLRSVEVDLGTDVANALEGWVARHSDTRKALIHTTGDGPYYDGTLSWSGDTDMARHDLDDMCQQYFLTRSHIKKSHQ